MATLWTSLGIIVISLIITIAINMKATMPPDPCGLPRLRQQNASEIAEQPALPAYGAGFNDSSLGRGSRPSPPNTMENMANVATARRHGHDPRAF